MDKHSKCLKSLGDLQSRIGLLLSAEAPAPSRQQGGQADKAEPRYVHREGSAGCLPDNVDPASLVWWCRTHVDHLTACLSGSAPTDRQLLAQAKLQLEPGWRDRLDSFDFEL